PASPRATVTADPPQFRQPGSLMPRSGALVAIQPACRRLADIPCRVDGARRNPNLLPHLGVADLTRNLELHLAIQDDDQLVGGVPKVLPALSRRVRPQVTAETPRCPVRSDLFAMNRSHGRVSGYMPMDIAPTGGIMNVLTWR